MSSKKSHHVQSHRRAPAGLLRQCGLLPEKHPPSSTRDCNLPVSGKRRNPATNNSGGSERSHLENGQMADPTTTIFQFSLPQEQAALRSTSFELFRRYHHAVFLEVPMGVVGSSQRTDFNFEKERWFPLDLSKLQNNIHVKVAPIRSLVIDVDYVLKPKSAENGNLASESDVRPPSKIGIVSKLHGVMKIRVRSGRQTDSTSSSGSLVQPQHTWRNHVNSLGDAFLANCPSLEHVHFSGSGEGSSSSSFDTIRFIGHQFLAHNPSLVKIQFDSDSLRCVERVGNSCFADCPLLGRGEGGSRWSLPNVLPFAKTLRSVGDGWLRGCGNLKESPFIHTTASSSCSAPPFFERLESIGAYWMANSVNLRRVVVDDKIFPALRSVGKGMCSNCEFLSSVQLAFSNLGIRFSKNEEEDLSQLRKRKTAAALLSSASSEECNNKEKLASQVFFVEPQDFCRDCPLLLTSNDPYSSLLAPTVPSRKKNSEGIVFTFDNHWNNNFDREQLKEQQRPNFVPHIPGTPGGAQKIPIYWGASSSPELVPDQCSMGK